MAGVNRVVNEAVVEATRVMNSPSADELVVAMLAVGVAGRPGSGRSRWWAAVAVATCLGEWLSWGDRPSSVCGGAQLEHSEARQVGGGGEKVEVGVDLGCASDPGSSPAVFAAHEVTEFAFN